MSLGQAYQDYSPGMLPSHLAIRLGLVLVDHAPGFNVAHAAFDLLADIDVVLDVLQRVVVGHVVEGAADSALGALMARSPTECPCSASFSPR
jgi:hypothetical protein